MLLSADLQINLGDIAIKFSPCSGVYFGLRKMLHPQFLAFFTAVLRRGDHPNPVRFPLRFLIP